MIVGARSMWRLYLKHLNLAQRRIAQLCGGRVYSKNAPARARALDSVAFGLEQIPQELVVDLVMELDFRRFDEGSQSARATVGGGLLQVGIAAFDVFAQKSCGPLGIAEVLERVVNVVGQIALGLAQVLDLRSFAVEAGL